MIDHNESRISIPSWQLNEIDRFRTKEEAEKFVEKISQFTDVKIARLRSLRPIKRWIVYTLR